MSLPLVLMVSRFCRVCGVFAIGVAYFYGENPYYPTDPAEELKALQDYKKELEAELAELTKRIEEIKKLIEKK
ncbi:MAG: hypothetical protein QXK18_02645 [Candidatus Bathyarchaeia archaeon]